MNVYEVLHVKINTTGEGTSRVMSSVAVGLQNGEGVKSVHMQQCGHFLI